MEYCLNRLDESVFMAGPKPMQTEFGKIDWRVLKTIKTEKNGNQKSSSKSFGLF